MNSKYTSPAPKRKLQETRSPSSHCQSSKKTATPNKLNESIEDKRAKKLKMIDEVLNIKSSHAKEANDPEKNPHLKSYFDKLQVQEKIDDKLSNTKTREIRAVTCKSCNYTSFSQSDYCRKLNHSISRHMSIQRYFKCKICNFKTHTIDKLYPASACGQCGNSMFESCGMKNQDISIRKTSENSSLEQASEMYLENGVS